MTNKKNQGFTLFELLVSISIIGILTALGVASFSSAQQKARDSRRIQDMDVIQKAAEQYYSAGGKYAYPADKTIASWTPTGQSPVLQSFPVDPKASNTPYSYTVTIVNTVPATYCACATLENTAMANSDATCNFAAVVPNLTSYCVKNQQ